MVNFSRVGASTTPPQTEEIRLDPSLTYVREKEAWEIGEKKLKEFDNLIPLLPQFEAYRDVCLRDYFDKII